MQSIVSRERSHLHDAGERRPSLNTGVTGSLMGWPGGRSRRRAHATTPSWRTAGEGSPVVAAFRAVAASGWLWAQAPERSAASPAPARWSAAAARTAVPRPARGCCPGPSGDPECGSTVRGPAGWGSPGPDGPRRGADPQPVQLLVDQDIPVRVGEHNPAPLHRGRYRSLPGLPTDLDDSGLPHSAPPAGPTREARGVKPLMRAAFSGVSEGTRTPDTQDHNLVL